MRKFNLRDHAAKRMMDLQKAGRSEEKAPVKAGAKGDAKAEACRPATVAGEGIRAVWCTDVGRVRKDNQDAVIAAGGLYGVADGMGGHNAGEIASGGLRDGLLQETAGKAPSPETLADAVKAVNLDLFNRQVEDNSLTGMGTTLTVLWPDEHEMIIAQVGDSRAYLLRGSVMKQITEDHSMVADMVRKGVLTEEQAACHPMRNYITRAVGTDEILDVDIICEKRHTGDRWLVCSDGLYGLMGKSVMAELAAIPDAEEAARQLMQTALNNGGKDNISLVLVDDTAEHAEDPDPVRPPETDEPSGEVADA